MLILRSFSPVAPMDKLDWKSLFNTPNPRPYKQIDWDFFTLESVGKSSAGILSCFNEKNCKIVFVKSQSWEQSESAKVDVLYWIPRDSKVKFSKKGMERRRKKEKVKKRGKEGM